MNKIDHLTVELTRKSELLVIEERRLADLKKEFGVMDIEDFLKHGNKVRWLLPLVFSRVCLKLYGNQPYTMYST